MTGAAKRFSDWYFDRTLPYWRAHSADPSGGGFHEALDANRKGTSADGKRIMVQARLCFVFAHAYCMRRDPANLAAAESGFAYLAGHGRHPDGGWYHKLTPDGAPCEQTRDLYDHAFILFAAACLDRAGVDGARVCAESTQAFLNAEMSHPEGGFTESLPNEKRPRRQNPHMHLLEAYLAWFETSGDHAWLDRAGEIVELSDRAFIHDGTLREYFTDDWRPAPGAAGRLTEPGHHFEWVWLLHRYGRLTGESNACTRSQPLYDFACAHGIDSANGGVVDEIAADGKLLNANRRLWPQTEAIKAHHARRLAGDAAAEARYQAALDALWRHHLDGEPEGGWREYLGPDGTLLRGDKPGSSLYHLAMAVGEISADDAS